MINYESETKLKTSIPAINTEAYALDTKTSWRYLADGWAKIDGALGLTVQLAAVTGNTNAFQARIIGDTVTDWKEYHAAGTVNYTNVLAATTLAASTPTELYISTAYSITLVATNLSRSFKLSSSVAYPIIIPSGVTMYYNGTPYTNVTKTVPLGFTMRLNQVNATTYFLSGNATLS